MLLPDYQILFVFGVFRVSDFMNEVIDRTLLDYLIPQSVSLIY